MCVCLFVRVCTNARMMEIVFVFFCFGFECFFFGFMFFPVSSVFFFVSSVFSGVGVGFKCFCSVSIVFLLGFK